MISYANMKLKPVSTTHDFVFNGQTIKILDYLPIGFSKDELNAINPIFLAVVGSLLLLIINFFPFLSFAI